jgi:hypothetical protein
MEMINLSEFRLRNGPFPTCNQHLLPRLATKGE